MFLRYRLDIINNPQLAISPPWQSALSDNHNLFPFNLSVPLLGIKSSKQKSRSFQGDPLLAHTNHIFDNSAQCIFTAPL